MVRGRVFFGVSVDSILENVFEKNSLPKSSFEPYEWVEAKKVD